MKSMFYLILGLAVISAAALYFFMSKKTDSSISLPALLPNSDNTDYVSVNYPVSNAGMLPPTPTVSASYNPNDLINTYSPNNAYILPPVPNPENTRPGSDISDYLNYSISDSQGHAHTYYFAEDRVPDMLLSSQDQISLNQVRLEEARYHNISQAANPLLISRAHALAYIHDIKP